MHDNRNERGPAKQRMIHVRLDSETHRKLRVRVAEKDVSIQEWVTSLIAEQLASYETRRERKPK